VLVARLTAVVDGDVMAFLGGRGCTEGTTVWSGTGACGVG
jgi:hypothetical protein